MATSVVEFLGEKGAAELLVKIDPNGSRRKELQELVNIAPNTLTKRLNEAREAGLIETQALGDPGETGHQYVMTPKGARLRLELEEEGVDKLYEQIAMYRAKLAGAVENTKEWTKDNDDKLANTRENRSILSYYQINPSEFDTSPSDSDQDS